MPKVSEREQMLQDLEYMMHLAAMDSLLDSSSSDDSDSKDKTSMFDDLAEMHTYISCSRFLTPRRYAPKSREFVRNYFPGLSEPQFRQLTRVSIKSFAFILSLIQSHPIFKSRGPRQQAPVWEQLGCALDRLGNNGDGASVGKTQQIWGIGKGTICLYTHRVLIALEALEKKYLAWPNASVRSRTSAAMREEGFNGCVGFVDGTCLPLSQRPTIDGDCYFDRKQRYSLNAQIVCNDRQKIIYFCTGYPGTCTDSFVYKKTILYRRPTGLFSSGEYLLADSAYEPTTTVVPAFKGQAALEPETLEFNSYLSRARVRSQQTIAMLKGRFMSLREIRIQIKARVDIKRILKWVKCCVILHNILNELDDDWTAEDGLESEEVDDEEPIDDEEVDIGGKGFRNRETVKRVCLQYHSDTT